jgi:hypothetical protein
MIFIIRVGIARLNGKLAFYQDFVHQRQASPLHFSITSDLPHIQAFVLAEV